MVFIIGGSYQGKEEYVLNRFSFAQTDIYVCTEAAEPDLCFPILSHIERFALYAVKNDHEPTDFWRAHRDALENKIIIADDISCGIVPMDAELRAWREASGRANLYLAREAASVHRVFCGLGVQIK